MSALGRQFHGARNEIRDTHVRPPSVTGAHPASSLGFSSGSDRPPHTDLAFATKSEDSAWHYARPVPSHVGAPTNHDPDPKHRGRVYEVEPAHDQHDTTGEIESPTGYKILREHHAPPGVMGTIPDLNWNAFKGRRGNHVVSSQDANQSYMDTSLEPPRKEHVPPPVREGADDYSNKSRVDERHPAQLNLFTGRTVEEHKTYTSTPGMLLHLHPTQFPHAADIERDPTTKTIRRAKEYHRIDTELGTVR